MKNRRIQDLATQDDVDRWRRDLEIAKEVGDKASEEKIYISLGVAYYNFGDSKRAMEYFEGQLEIAKELGHKPEERNAYRNLGTVYCELKDFKRGIEYYEHRLEIDKAVYVDQCPIYNNLGVAYLALGNFERGVENLECALKIAKKLEDKDKQKDVYRHLGVSYYRFGDLKRAIEYYERALTIYSKEVGDKASEGRIYSVVGYCHYQLADFKRAIECQERALTISKEVGDKASEGECYCYLGESYGKVGDFKGAIEYLKLGIEIAKEVGDKTAEGSCCNILGGLYCNELKQFKSGIEYLQRSEKNAKEVGDKDAEGRSYVEIGKAYFILGFTERAIEYLELALKIAKEVGDKALEGHAYGYLGFTYHRLNDFKKGIEYQESAVNIAREAGDKLLVATFLCNLSASLAYQGSMVRAIKCCHSGLVIFNDIRAALHFNDKWKIGFRDSRKNAYTLWLYLHLKQGEPVKALFAAEEVRAQALRDLIDFKYGSGEANYQSQFLEEPACAPLGYLSSDTVFLAVGPGHILFWVIQNGKGVELRRKNVNEFISAEEVTTFITLLNRDLGIRAGANCENRSLDEICDENMAKERSLRDTSTSLESQRNALRKFYDIIVSPIADLITGNEVVLVPEGPLFLVPYAALVDSKSKYLCESLRVRLISSLTTLKLITDCPADFHKKTGALLVGDPCLEEVRYMGRKLDELPNARKEVEMIGQVLNTAPLIGKEATKDEVLKRLSSVALVHIAAHGRLETGEILLAPNPTRENSQPEEKDYLLTMADVLQAGLRARLVVLSCCHSARGEVMAEGVVGIARAFLGAGARSVLVSLWALDDEATMHFMEHFYKELVKGEKVSEALNRAMERMRKSDRFSDMRYWAPFVLIGDDVTLELTQSS